MDRIGIFPKSMTSAPTVFAARPFVVRKRRILSRLQWISIGVVISLLMSGQPVLAGTFPEPPPDPAKTQTTAAVRPKGVLAIGDFVMLGASSDLAGRLGEGSVVDAVDARPFSAALKAVQKQVGGGRQFGAIVVHLGNNGSATKSQLQEFLDAVGPTIPVLFLTMRESRVWAPKLNAMLRAMARSRSNMKVLDWAAATDKYPYLFSDDQLHLSSTGAEFYSDFVVWGLQQAGYISGSTKSAPVKTSPQLSTTSAPPAVSKSPTSAAKPKPAPATPSIAPSTSSTSAPTTAAPSTTVAPTTVAPTTAEPVAIGVGGPAITAVSVSVGKVTSKDTVTEVSLVTTKVPTARQLP